MNNKHNPTDSVQGPEQPPSMLKLLCGNNGYDRILPEAEEAVACTKGEWKAVRYKVSGAGEGNGDEWTVECEDKDGITTICEIDNTTTDAEAKANAILIANAPKTKRQRDMLLEACKGLLAIAKLCDSPRVFTSGARELLRAEVKQAEAAIKDCEESK